MTTATIDLWKIAMLAANYLGRPKETPMNHTRTREQQFTAEIKATLAREAVEQAVREMIGKARNDGYEHEVEKTFLVRVVREGAGFSATAAATYAKIVPASTSARPATPEPVDESL